MATVSKSDLYRKLPAVDELLRRPELVKSLELDGRDALVDAARTVLARLRQEITAGYLDSSAVDLALANITTAVERQLQQDLAYSLYPVINATGVILHTNLGRAPLAPVSLQRIQELAGAYSNLEFDLSTGERGERDVHVDRLFRKLLQDQAGSEADVSTIVVNNNAAAVMLALNTLAEGGEVIVSRGELVEIGGSFRIPDIMSKSNAVLREVGTTNRTRLSDYERAINDKTRLLLRVHRSNFEITGFTEQPSLSDLVKLAQQKKIPLLEDLGSGALVNLAEFGLMGEQTVLESLQAGVDVVTYSGDKLLGGPQAGMLSGKQDLIRRMRSNSMFRALRVDKLTYSALEATLLAYAQREYDTIPALRMMRVSKEQIRARAEILQHGLQASQLELLLQEGDSVVGGGAAPSAVLPTVVLAVSARHLTTEELSARLRASEPPVIARIEDGRILIDCRTVFPEQDELLLAILRKATHV